MLLSICLQLLLNNSNLHNCSEAMAPKGEKKYDSEFDGVSSGELYRVYRRLLFNEATGITDDGGDSAADLFLQTDVGFKLIIDTQGNQDLVTLFSDAPPLGAGHFFQQGLTCLNHLDGLVNTPFTQTELDDMEEEWRALGIVHNVGIHEDSITAFVSVLTKHNSMRPAANRYTVTGITEKLLQSIFKCSTHFHHFRWADHLYRPGPVLLSCCALAFSYVFILRLCVFVLKRTGNHCLRVWPSRRLLYYLASRVSVCERVGLLGLWVCGLGADEGGKDLRICDVVGRILAAATCAPSQRSVRPRHRTRR
jgi:hypothetical protein